jgi:hypothetical protein
LLAFLPRTVFVGRNHQVVEIPAATRQPGDKVMLKPGGRIPVDGLMLGGRSFVDQDQPFRQQPHSIWPAQGPDLFANRLTSAPVGAPAPTVNAISHGFGRLM